MLLCGCVVVPLCCCVGVLLCCCVVVFCSMLLVAGVVFLRRVSSCVPLFFCGVLVVVDVLGFSVCSLVLLCCVGCRWCVVFRRVFPGSRMWLCLLC